MSWYSSLRTPKGTLSRQRTSSDPFPRVCDRFNRYLQFILIKWPFYFYLHQYFNLQCQFSDSGIKRVGPLVHCLCWEIWCYFRDLTRRNIASGCSLVDVTESPFLQFFEAKVPITFSFTRQNGRQSICSANADPFWPIPRTNTTIPGGHWPPLVPGGYSLPKAD